MGNNQWDYNENPFKGVEPDAGGGSYTPGSTLYYNPSTGRYEPTTPQAGAPGGGGGLGNTGSGGGNQQLPPGKSFSGIDTTPATPAGGFKFPTETWTAAEKPAGGSWLDKFVGSNAGGKGGVSYLDWLAFAANVYEAQKQGSFQTPPMSPEQRQMFTWAMGVLQATPNTSAMAVPLLQHYIGNSGTLDMAALRRGETGYTPRTQMSATELAAILGGGAPKAPPPTGP